MHLFAQAVFAHAENSQIFNPNLIPTYMSFPVFLQNCSLFFQSVCVMSATALQHSLSLSPSLSLSVSLSISLCF